MRTFLIVVMLAAVLAVASSASAPPANANAADLQTLTALTLSIKAVTVNYAFAAYGYGLTDYSGGPAADGRVESGGECAFSEMSGSWTVLQCGGGVFDMAGLEAIGVPSNIAYQIVRSNSANWAAERAVDAGNGVPTPAPIPPPCSADASGYCAAGGPLTVISSVTCMVPSPHGGKVPVRISTSTSQAFIVYMATDYVERTTKFTRMSNATCDPFPSGLTTTWSPGEPSVQYGDPNLP